MRTQVVTLTKKCLARIGSRLQLRIVSKRADGAVVVEITERRPAVLKPGGVFIIEGNIFSLAENQPRSQAAAKIAVETELDVRVVPTT